MLFDTYIVLVMNLILGIQAIQQPRQTVPLHRAALYARAAAHHGLRSQLDPFELIALARHESGFNDAAIGPDGLDCGLTQTRIIYSRYTCAQLQRSAWLAFAEAARELSAYRKSCRGQPDYDRCRLNKYNSGARYARRGFHGRYYLRVRCYAQAARHNVPIAHMCRDARSEDEIALWVRQAVDKRQPQTVSPQLEVAQLSAPQSAMVQGSAPPWQVTVQAIGVPIYEQTEAAIVERRFVQDMRRSAHSTW
jgi:hypothetical protein